MGRILVADDDDSVRMTLRMLLTGMGHQVTEARNGAEAIAAFQADPTNIIITDLMMPKGGGLDAIRQLRKDYPQAKIIAMSGGLSHGPDALLDLAEMLGAQQVLRKPFTKEDLRLALVALGAT